jgi:hypothetical protein
MATVFGAVNSDSPTLLFARFTRRTKRAVAQLPGERRIRPVVAQRGNLVEQGAAPQMRIFAKSLGAVDGEPVERVRLTAGPLTGDALAGQVGADGLAVFPQVPGDRRDRPTLLVKRVDLHVVLPCQHEQQEPFRAGVWSETASLEGVPPHPAEPHGVRNSVSRSAEFQMSVVNHMRSGLRCRHLHLAAIEPARQHRRAPRTTPGYLWPREESDTHVAL